MGQNEFKEIRPGDWQALREAYRRVNERLAELEGHGSENYIRDNQNMDGNQIINGPWGQSTADGDEFITKEYLQSPEAGAIIAKSMQDGGVNPFYVDPSLPGGLTGFSGGDLVLPELYILGGEEGSIMTDFTPSTRMWVPQYNPQGYCDLTWTTDGALTVGCHTSLTTNRPYVGGLCGVNARFRLFPDAVTGRIVYRYVIENCSWDTPIPATSRCGVWIGCYTGIFVNTSPITGATIMSNGSTTDAFPGYGQIGGSYYLFGPQDIFYQSPLISLGTGGFNECEFEVVIDAKQYSSSNWNLEVSEYNINVEGSGWVDAWPNTPGDPTTWGGWPVPYNGVDIFLGLVLGDYRIMSGTISQFELVEGVLCR